MTLYLYGDVTRPPLNETFTPDRVQSIIETSPGDFYTFQEAIQHSHNSVHQLVGGDLNEQCPGSIPPELCRVSYTTNGDSGWYEPMVYLRLPLAFLDPIFWLHHAQMDRLWSVVSTSLLTYSQS